MDIIEGINESDIDLLDKFCNLLQFALTFDEDEFFDELDKVWDKGECEEESIAKGAFYYQACWQQGRELPHYSLIKLCALFEKLQNS